MCYRPRMVSRAAKGDTASYGRSVITLEARTLDRVAKRLDGAFERAVELIVNCSGRVVCTGLGKAGFVAQKLSATLSSTGTPSLFLHPAEALHGDLGRVTKGDLAIAFSYSGETDEVLRLIPTIRKLRVPVIALTGHSKSRLAKLADPVIDLGQVAEACPLGLAPTASTVALLAVADALAMTVLQKRPFDETDYARLHPGGKLGRRLLTVAAIMRRGQAMPIVRETTSVRNAASVMTRTQGRPGAACVVDEAGRLSGILTDGDLRRLVERGETNFTRPVSKVMGPRPATTKPAERAMEAAERMRKLQIDQLPVVDDDGRPVGLLDVQDVLAAGIVTAE